MFRLFGGDFVLEVPKKYTNDYIAMKVILQFVEN